MSVPNVKLSGSEIPQVGLGFWQVKNQAEFDRAFKAGIDAGYRHFDSAQVYKNEAMLGTAWKASGLPREDFFLTTKIWIRNFKKSKVHASFAESLQKLQTDHVDLLLLHFPVTFWRRGAWKALEEIHAAGGATNIGVSNYTVRHLKGLKRYGKVTPAVNQVELHIFLQQPELVEYCHKNGIVIEAYSPLAHSREMHDPVVQGIADKHHKSYAQIMLRWLIQNDLVILPKSVTPSRIAENIDVYGFELDTNDMAKLQTRDKDLRTCWSPTHVL
jgi:diketogulonate reductase-like aldo/keto reductase